MRGRPSSIILASALLTVPVGAVEAQRPTAGGDLTVTVQDETLGRLVHAVVTLAGAAGFEVTRAVDERGVATFLDLTPGLYTLVASAEAFQPLTRAFEVKPGANEATMRLSVAIAEEITVDAEDAASRRDGFTTALTPEEIDALSDDPDEMADQLAEMAGPGAQIFVDGFEGGRLPPKDQIQQIRFRRNAFAAEYHDAGRVRVEIITRPGVGAWRGRANVGFRDASLNARDAFARVVGPEQRRRYLFNLGGPLRQGQTSISMSVDGLAAHSSEPILARTPVGEVSDLVRQTTDNLNVTLRLDHGLGEGSQIRTEFSRRSSDRRNLGVGEFNLADRAYEQDQVTDQFRLRNTRMFGKRVFSELRVEARRSTTTFLSVSAGPAVRVLDSFTSGGAGRDGTRTSQELEIAQNVDWSTGTHALRGGVLLESGWWDSTQTTNANGTFTFRTLDDYVAGRASQFSRLVGDPAVDYAQHQLGLYVQDDVALTRDLAVSLGVRQEVQTYVADAWNLAPRLGVTWSPRGTGLSVRGGYGIFYDWFETNLYEQTLQVDGRHQLEEVVIDPSFPDAFGSTGEILPPSIIRLGDRVELPTIHQASIGVDRQLVPWLGLRADYLLLRGTGQFQAVNVNAPLADGTRPDPAVGNVSEILSDGRSATDRLGIGLTLMIPDRRIFGHATYQLASSRNQANSALQLPSDSTHLDADWGPAANDVRHRLMPMLNTPIWIGIRGNLMVQGSSGLPYTITTGFDDNGDTVFNDRPAGVGRNTERGAAQWTVSLRVNRSFSLGGSTGGDPGAPMGAGGEGGGAMMQRGEGGGPRMMVMEAGNARYRLDFYAQVSNLLNHTNYTGFIGNRLSPYFGQPTAALSARRVELGASITF